MIRINSVTQCACELDIRQIICPSPYTTCCADVSPYHIQAPATDFRSVTTFVG